MHADRSSSVVASEFTTTSMSSQGVAQKAIGERMAENPNIRLANGEFRGHLRLDATPDRLQADMIALDARRELQSGRKVLASFVMEAGRPEAVRAG
jgi:alkaline phosphatase D